jgi:TonB family protein
MKGESMRDSVIGSRYPRVLCILLAVSGCATLGPNASYQDRIEAALMQRKDDFRRCYEDVLQDSQSEPIRGQVVSRFTLTAGGAVSSALIKSSTLNQPKVEACILKTITSIRFPVSPTKETTDVTYPFNFRP